MNNLICNGIAAISGISVRKAAAEDVPHVASLWRSLVGSEGCTWDEGYPGVEEAASDVEKGELYVLCGEEGEIIGAMCAGEDEELWDYEFWDKAIKNRCCCARLGIAKKYQNMGLAKELFRAVERDVRKKGFDGIGFLVSPGNARALAAYEKLGYKSVGECSMFEQDWYCYEKKLSTITTYSGVSMDPVNPWEDEILMEDMAHALSMVCRGGGHVKVFYSVAQHCLVCAEEARLRGYSLRVQLGALLHDGSEAYMADLVRPVKVQIPRYSQIEDRLIELIWKKFIPEGGFAAKSESKALTDEERRAIKEIDDDVMSWDLKILLGDEINEDYLKLKHRPEHKFEPMDLVEEKFLAKYVELCRKMEETL